MWRHSNNVGMARFGFGTVIGRVRVTVLYHWYHVVWALPAHLYQTPPSDHLMSDNVTTEDQTA